MNELWIWQRIVSPHIAGMADSLGKKQPVVYVAEKVMTATRTAQGWNAPTLRYAELRRVRSAQEVVDLVDSAPKGSIHFCQGVRANGLIGVAQRCLALRNREQWIVMEQVNNTGFMGAIRRSEYRRCLRRMRGKVEGILAIGDRTTRWIVERGWNERQVFPFAYFIPPAEEVLADRRERERGRLRLVFVGQLIRLKRLELVIEALRRIPERDVELTVVGGGPLEETLRRRARAALDEQVLWVGRVSMGVVQREMARADCLVLPSSHDGWGVVVTEALMVGTPVICSDRCGAAGVVRRSGQGGVFKSGDVADLAERIGVEVDSGGQCAASRRELRSWAQCLGADAGAEYLRRIVRHAAGDEPRPAPPWSGERYG